MQRRKKTQQHKMWQKSETQNETKLKNKKCDNTLKLIKSKFKRTENPKCDKTQKIKMWQN